MPATTAYTECPLSWHKAYVNYVLLPRLLASVPGDQQVGNVIVLDGPDMHTSTALVQRAGIAASRIHVVERDAATLHVMRRRVANARLSRPTGQLGRVNVHADDVFRYLARSAKRPRARAMVLDLMQGMVTDKQQRIIADAATANGAELLTLTLSGRPGGMRTDSVADRLQALQAGPIGRVFRGTRYVYGYQRHRNASMMYFVAMQRRPCHASTRYRPRSVGKKANAEGKVRVQWYGWPGDDTYERLDDVQTS